MTTLRLHVDGMGKGWAIVRCNVCTDVDKYPALDAFDAPVKCRCGYVTNVRDALMAEINKRPDAPGELVAFSGAMVVQLSTGWQKRTPALLSRLKLHHS
jgi:hypothetical protein